MSGTSIDVIGAYGPINGMGERDPFGSYVALAVVTKAGERVVYKISHGAAQALAAELNGCSFAAKKMGLRDLPVIRSQQR